MVQRLDLQHQVDVLRRDLGARSVVDQSRSEREHDDEQHRRGGHLVLLVWPRQRQGDEDEREARVPSTADLREETKESRVYVAMSECRAEAEGGAYARA